MEAICSYKIEVYNKVENNTSDIYLYNITAAETKSVKPDHNMRMICHKKEEKNADREKLIKVRIFKYISRNVIKQLRLSQEMHETTKITIIRAIKFAKIVIK